MMKILSKLGAEGNFSSLIKNTYQKPTVNMTLNGEAFKAFPLRSGTRQGCPLSPLLYNIALEVLVNTKRQGNKRYTDWE